ncbi:MAG: NAD(P)/FAD-dependent oxidoreductase [Capsulimonadales bacterium]|nr:NAD(P)/FAD-dependent oxidoreductase [Capsulimonadales bacterium]
MKHFDYLLIGGGIASVAAAQSIRERDGGSILILKDEPRPPYDHPPLSKDYLKRREIGEGEAYSKEETFYRQRGIDLRTGVRVTAIDTSAQTVTTDRDERLHYGKLLLATGSSARRLEVPGAHAPNVFTLRTLDDSLALRQAFEPAQRVLVVGAGYIGMEVAAAAAQRGLQVTVVDPEPYPFRKFASETFGNFIKRYFTRKGVRFLLGNEVACIDCDPETGMAHSVCLKSGQPVPTDVVVTGVGAKLNLDLAISAGLETDETEGVLADEFLRTSAPNVYVAGDIAYFKDIILGKRWHAEHHLNAKWQGEAVGRNLAGEVEPYNRVAYFFSDLFDIHMILRGDPKGGEGRALLGDIEGAEFIELYGDEEDRLTMGVAVSRDETKLGGISDTLDRMIRERVSIPQAVSRLSESERTSFIGLPSMAAVLGMIAGSEALHFLPAWNR